MNAGAEAAHERCRVLVAQIGARRHYVVPRALYRMGMLHALVTDFCANGSPWRWLDRLLPRIGRPGALRRLLGRRVPDLSADMIVDFPLFAASLLLDHRSNEPRTDRWARRNGRFARLASTRIDGRANTVYAFNGAALELFLAARDRGLTTVLDQTAAPWRYNADILAVEADKWPGWETLPLELDRSGKLGEREEREWQLSDRIICGSSFAAEKVETLGGPANLIRVVPYPGPHVSPGDPPIRVPARPLRVLFVGTLTLRKGLPYLLAAEEKLGAAITVRLVGPSALSERAMTEITARMDWLGAVARDQVDEHYRWADVFVLPTLSEGSANVCHEAMAAGLPVITTPQAGSIITHGEDGLLVPAADQDALAQAIMRLADDLEYRARLGRAARLAIAGRTFAAYASELAAGVTSTTMRARH